MKVFRSLFEVLRSAAFDIGRRPMASALSIVAMTVAVFVFAVFLLLGHGVKGFLDRWANQTAVEVFLADGIDRGEIDELVARLERDDTVRRVDRVSSEAALAEFEQLFPDFENVEEILGENPFPASLRLVPASPDPERIVALVSRTEDDAAVAAVRYDREWIEALARMGKAISWFVFGGAMTLLLAALVTVGSVVRLALDDKRDEVLLMRLVGAPASFVIGPVLLSGALLGGMGGGLALLLASFSRSAFLSASSSSPLLGIAEVLAGEGLPPLDSILLFALSVVAGTVAAGLAAGKAAIT